MFKEQDFAYEELTPLPIKPETLLSEFNLYSHIIPFKPNRKQLFSRSFTGKLDLHRSVRSIATNDKEKAPIPLTNRISNASEFYLAAIESPVNFTQFYAMEFRLKTLVTIQLLTNLNQKYFIA